MTERTQKAENGDKRAIALKNYRDELAGLVGRSNEIFEKQLSYISAGAIAVSMAFVKDVTGALSLTRFKIFLIAGWFFLVLTLLVNMLSHRWTKNKHNRTIEEIDRGCYNRVDALKRLKQIDRTNLFTIMTLIAGICLVVIFMVLNIQ